MADIGRACVTCRHPARAAIEDALVSGRSSIRGISRHFDIDSESLRRHVRNHLDPAVQEALRAVPGVSALDIAGRLLSVADDAHGVRVDAAEAGTACMSRSMAVVRSAEDAAPGSRLGHARVTLF
jgi:hypothetical protein